MIKKLREKIGKLYQSWVHTNATEEENDFQNEFNGDAGAIDAMSFYAGYLLGMKDTPKHETVEGWISVSERLPEHQETVIMYSSVFKEKHVGEYLKNINRWVFNGDINDCVTHWQPLPEDPEEE